MSQYDTSLDLSNPNTSHAQIVEVVGYNKRVLDAGCATGYLARALVERQCVVSGVEVDLEAAEQARPVLERLVVGDLEAMDLVTEFGEDSFDAVVFGDVIEHLRDPLPTLGQARRLLRRGGSVVISVPNIGHGAMRLALLKGQWQYRPLGLLDTTHLRFFTRESLSDLLHQAGLIAIEIRQTTHGLFETEFDIRPEDYSPEVIEAVLADPEATTYQFVVRAVRDDGDRAVVELRQREEQQRDQIHQLTRELERVTGERDAAMARADADAARAAELAGALEVINGSSTMRLTRRPRAVYRRLRRLGSE